MDVGPRDLVNEQRKKGWECLSEKVVGYNEQARSGNVQVGPEIS